jgi:hypothetical protein
MNPDLVPGHNANKCTPIIITGNVEAPCAALYKSTKSVIATGYISFNNHNKPQQYKGKIIFKINLIINIIKIDPYNCNNSQ